MPRANNALVRVGFPDNGFTDTSENIATFRRWSDDRVFHQLRFWRKREASCLKAAALLTKSSHAVSGTKNGHETLVRLYIASVIFFIEYKLNRCSELVNSVVGSTRKPEDEEIERQG